MDFNFTSEQNSIYDTALRFAREELAPLYQSNEVAGCIDVSVRKKLAALGFICSELPEELGGSNQNFVTVGLIIDALSQGDFNVSYLVLLASLNAQIIHQHMNEQYAKEWLVGMTKGEIITALALTEPDHGSDAANIQLKAEKHGDHYILNGEKTSISMADQADAAIVFSRTGSIEDGAHGISAFLVALDSPGISRTRFSDMGEVPIGRGSIFFENVKVPRTHLIGAENKGFTQVMQGFDFSRALIGLQCIATAQQTLKETWKYISERKTFGQPLSNHQGVSFPLAEQETYLYAARDLCYKTLWLKTAGKPHTKEAAMCKWWAPKAAYDTIYQCLLSHGHSGYSKDLPIEQRLRDVLGLQIGDGTAQIMKMVIARHSIKENA